MTFEQFIKKCDAIVASHIGLGIDDLPDACWRDYYDDGLSPADAIEVADLDYWDGRLSECM